MEMIVAIVGPTGVGKTKMSIALAKKYHGIIINCDAVQVYKGMDIGSAKATIEEQKEIPHYLIDIKTPDEEYTVFDYQKDLRALLAEHQDKNIFIVGGTGLYLSAGLMDYRFSEENYHETYDEYSNEELYELCLKKDENTTVDKHNRQRLIRFLNRGEVDVVSPKMLYDVKIIGLRTDREHLYELINERVDEMINANLIAEVTSLNALYPESRVLNTAIGYKEIKAYLDKTLTLEEATDLIKKNTRHYAKRQFTWFNNKMHVHWLDVNYENFNETIEEAIKYLEN